ncbi:hypothetical protein PstZobell_00897 [Stutzerimonas stutzeri ATCC 14405 = CCUG 16156]|uniref:hypothetical protein n=1 Tax=Stutzerimonas stutzeri TaxID=316 RepID=UPI0002549540|nr:hypothetical protein [Stutzerimonas stutzeri]EHY75978.1 hypothetical protein PstZobell_00897 [Stutzerimonas stutzeri ATCC 14405 = CCUG 16156]QOZ96014.1 hypothetical protein Pstu14405_12050 [Stutzerimonas stutzeri]
MRDFQSGFEYLSRSKKFLHSLGRSLPVVTSSNRPEPIERLAGIEGRSKRVENWPTILLLKHNFAVQAY